MNLNKSSLIVGSDDGSSTAMAATDEYHIDVDTDSRTMSDSDKSCVSCSIASEGSIGVGECSQGGKQKNVPSPVVRGKSPCAKTVPHQELTSTYTLKGDDQQDGPRRGNAQSIELNCAGECKDETVNKELKHAPEQGQAAQNKEAEKSDAASRVASAVRRHGQSHP